MELKIDRTRISNEKGAALIEYVMLASLIALCVISGVSMITSPMQVKLGIAAVAIKGTASGIGGNGP